MELNHGRETRLHAALCVECFLFCVTTISFGFLTRVLFLLQFLFVRACVFVRLQPMPATKERDTQMDTAFSVPSRQLFIGNLSSWIAEKDLHAHFGQFGEIERYAAARVRVIFLGLLHDFVGSRWHVVHFCC